MARIGVSPATAPLETALERCTKHIGAGALEAQHLREEMVGGRAEYERLFGSHMNCDGAPGEVDAIIAKTDRYGPR
jgi:hypothetical protein